jgi:hypothetical protein
MFPSMGLTWRATSTQRWRGVDDDGKHIGHVGLVVWGGAANSAWHGWRYDGSPNGIDLGNFDTAEQAMAAVDDDAGTPGPPSG